jgi:RNase P/RNase MRP subunit p29
MEEFTPPHVEPAKPRKISEIKTGDERVRVVGLVVDKKEAELVLDDGSGRITVIFDDPALTGGVEVGSKIRVFGSPLNVADTHELHADIIQRLDKLDLELYDRVRREVKKFEKELQQ